MRDLNPQPSGSEPDALPIELIRIISSLSGDWKPSGGKHCIRNRPLFRAQRLAGVLQNPLDLLSIIQEAHRTCLWASSWEEVKNEAQESGNFSTERVHSRLVPTETTGSTKQWRQNDLLHDMFKLDCFCLKVRTSESPFFLLLLNYTPFYLICPYFSKIFESRFYLLPFLRLYPFSQQ